MVAQDHNCDVAGQEEEYHYCEKYIRGTTTFLLLLYLLYIVVLDLTLDGTLGFLNWSRIVIERSLIRLERWFLESRMVVLIVDHPSVFRHISSILIATGVCLHLAQDLLVDAGSVEVDLLSAEGAVGLSFLEGEKALLADGVLLGANQKRCISRLVVLF